MRSLHHHHVLDVRDLGPFHQGHRVLSHGIGITARIDRERILLEVLAIAGLAARVGAFDCHLHNIGDRRRGTLSVDVISLRFGIPEKHIRIGGVRDHPGSTRNRSGY